MSSTKLGSLCTAFVLVLAITCASCQLKLTAEQRSNQLELHCYVSGTQSFSYSPLVKLVISKLNRDVTHDMASVSLQSKGPSTNLSGVEVTGQLSNEDTSRRFIKIVFTRLNETLNGHYTCHAHGINNDLISIQQINVKLLPTGPDFHSSPDVIREGLTKRLDISCSIPDQRILNITKVGRLDIFKTQNKYTILIGRAVATSGTTLISGLPGFNIVGTIDTFRAYLNVTWKHPRAEQSGEYICEIIGAGVKGDPLFFNSSISVTWEQPGQEELIQHLSEMTNRQKELVRFEDNSEQLLQEVVEALAMTETSQCRNPTSCDDVYFSLKPGQHIVIVEPEDGLGPITVLCDVVGRREIYTVFQKRFNGEVNFYRNFSEYENGFGSVAGEFWLGLKNIRRLLIQNGDKNQLRVDMTVMGPGINYTRIYPTFTIGPGDAYRLTVSGLYDRGYGMSSNSHKQFSTYDHGLKHIANMNNRGAGWWFPEDQGYVNLNGVWGVPGKPYSIFWWELRQDLNFILEKTEMKFRRHTNK